MSHEEKLKALQAKFKAGMDRTNGVISTSMNVNSKPSHKLYYNGYWILIDGKMPENEFLELKEYLKKGE